MDWHLWDGHVDPLGLDPFVPGTPAEVRFGEVVVPARRTREALCEVVIRANVRARMLNGWRVDRARVEVRTWRATATVYQGYVTPRWEWR